MKSWELRKCIDHSRDNMHTDVRVKSVKGLMYLSFHRHFKRCKKIKFIPTRGYF